MCRVDVVGGTMEQAEIAAYVAHAREKYGREPDSMTLAIDGEYVDMDCRYFNPFSRIRRITGYRSARWEASTTASAPKSATG